jgi:hypothetical protein
MAPIKIVFRHPEKVSVDKKKFDRTKGKKVKVKKRKTLKNLTKLMAKDALSENCKGFTLPNGKNIILMEDPKEYEIVKGYVSKKKLSELKFKEAPKYVMVDTGSHVYRRITMSAYKELSKILYITLRLRISSLQDGEDDYYEFLDHTFNISSLNQLFSVLNRRAGVIDGLSIHHNGQGWFTETKRKETVKILFDKNTVEVMTLDKFLKKYNLTK